MMQVPIFGGINIILQTSWTLYLLIMCGLVYIRLCAIQWLWKTWWKISYLPANKTIVTSTFFQFPWYNIHVQQCCICSYHVTIKFHVIYYRKQHWGNHDREKVISPLALPNIWTLNPRICWEACTTLAENNTVSLWKFHCESEKRNIRIELEQEDENHPARLYLLIICVSCSQIRRMASAPTGL